MSNEIVIIGGGGHAKVVIATAEASGFKVVSVFDDDPTKWNQKILGVQIEGPIRRAAERRGVGAVFGMGCNEIRKRLASEMKLEWVTLQHPSAIVHASVNVGAGTVIFANAVIQPDAMIGEHAIINTAASIDHDCRIGAFAHIAPGVALSGDVHVGEGSLMGVGSCAKPGMRIGDWAIVGAGAVVVSEVEARTLVVGVPAKSPKYHGEGHSDG